MRDEAKKEALANGHKAAAGRPRIEERSSKDNIEDEAEWIMSTLTRILHKHISQITVTG